MSNRMEGREKVQKKSTDEDKRRNRMCKRQMERGVSGFWNVAGKENELDEANN